LLFCPHVASIFCHGTTAPSGQGLFIYRRSTIIRRHARTHTHTRPVADDTQHSKETDIHAPGAIRTRNPSKQTAQPLESARSNCNNCYSYGHVRQAIESICCLETVERETYLSFRRYCSLRPLPINKYVYVVAPVILSHCLSRPFPNPQRAHSAML
jgi:hypothetical protein